MTNIKIDRATQMYNRGQLVIGQPQYRGNKALFMPFIDKRTGEPVTLNPVSCRAGGSIIPARQHLFNKNIKISDAMRFGMSLVSWLEGYDGPDKWAMAEELVQFLGEPGPDGKIRLELDVGPYLVRRTEDPDNGRG